MSYSRYWKKTQITSHTLQIAKLASVQFRRSRMWSNRESICKTTLARYTRYSHHMSQSLHPKSNEDVHLNGTSIATRTLSASSTTRTARSQFRLNVTDAANE